ncbi:MAG: Kelch repeat-containing protein, partial [Planctomycetota bacterium]
GTDWTAGAFDLKAGKWVPLPPRGKESWVKSRPKMRYWTRWGSGTYLDRDSKRPIPVCHFNQACYLPTVKKILYYVGDRTMLFDLEKNDWEHLRLERRPPLVLWSALCYDAVNDEAVLFGGSANDETARPGTWLFDVEKKSWRKLEQPLDRQPPPRCNAPLAYDSKNKLIAVFGGDAQDRYLSDTWVYDCAKREWRELKTNVNPFPRSVPAFCYLEKHGVFMMAGGVPGNPGPPSQHHRPYPGADGKEVWVLDAAKAEWRMVGGGFPGGFWASAVYDPEGDRVILHRTNSKYPSHAQLEFREWKPKTAAAGKGFAHDGKPVYKYNPPEWYTQGTGRGAKLSPVDEKAGEKLFASLKPNEWVAIKCERPAYARTWGTVAYDPDRQEVLLWGGGHCGYCGTDVGHFSLKTLRWETGFPPEFPPAPYSGFYGDESSFLISSRTFKGRPWTQHGRVSYAYDPVTKMVAFTQHISRTPTRGFTYIYDPAKRDFVDVFPQPFIPGWAVSGLNVSTPHGVYSYLTPGDHRSRQLGLSKLDVKGRKWTNLSGGKHNAPAKESHRVVYDSKRDRLILVTGKRKSRTEQVPQMWAWDLKAGGKEWLKLEMSGEVPPHFYRECVYIPKYDCLLNSPRTGKGQNGTVYHCDLAAGNKWHKTGFQLPLGVGPGTGLVYDRRVDVLIAMRNPTQGPCRVWIGRYVPSK